MAMLHPGRLTWNIIMEAWKIIFLSKRVICRFYVNLPGCTLVYRRVLCILGCSPPMRIARRCWSQGAPPGEKNTQHSDCPLSSTLAI